MQLQLDHERLGVYGIYLGLAGQCGDIIAGASASIVALDHLDRAMESIGVNLIRGNTQAAGSASRASCFDIAIASTHECAAALDVCLARDVLAADAHDTGMNDLWRVRGMLLGLKKSSADRVREERAVYGSPTFPHVALNMYTESIDAVRWLHLLLQEHSAKSRMKRKLDVSTTGTVLNIAEGYGRVSSADQNRFMKTAYEHAYQTILLLDLLVARKVMPADRIAHGKAIQARVISMLHGWIRKHRETEDDDE